MGHRAAVHPRREAKSAPDGQCRYRRGTVGSGSRRRCTSLSDAGCHAAQVRVHVGEEGEVAAAQMVEVPALPLLGIMLAAIALMTWLHLRTRVPDLLVLVAAGAISLTMLLAA